MRKVTKNNTTVVKVMAGVLAGLMIFSVVTTLVIFLVQ